jgi:hypothetical protein
MRVVESKLSSYAGSLEEPELAYDEPTLTKKGKDAFAVKVSL